MSIYIEPDVLMQKGEEIAAIRSELETLLSRIEILVLSLCGEWQGAAEIAFEHNLIGVKKDYSDLLCFISEYSNIITNCADRYEKYDNDLANKINSI